MPTLTRNTTANTSDKLEEVDDSPRHLRHSHQSQQGHEHKHRRTRQLVFHKRVIRLRWLCTKKPAKTNTTAPQKTETHILAHRLSARQPGIENSKNLLQTGWQNWRMHNRPRNRCPKRSCNWFRLLRLQLQKSPIPNKKHWFLAGNHADIEH